MMDKAKAYDEALENASKLRDDCQKELDKTDKTSRLADLLRSGISAVEIIFPQLKDSDDERIRKQLVDIVAFIPEANFKSASREDCRTYLEKQKESLRDFIDDFPYSDEPKVDIDKLRRDLYQSGYNDGYQHGKEDAQKEQKHILKFKVGDKVHLEGDDVNILTITGIEKDRYLTDYANGPILFGAEDIWQIVEQESTPNTYGCLNCTKLEECEKGLTPCSEHRLKIVDQKPADDKAFEEWIDSWFKEHKEKAYPQITMDEKEFKNFCRGIRNMYQQKSDWNEEDERMLSRCIKSIECSKKFADSETYKTAKDAEINWLKDIFLDYKKFTEAVDKLWSNDWNEEDEKDMAHIIRILDDCYAYGKHDLSKTDYENLVNKLKSLHPIKQDWTEEDEKMLNLAIEWAETMADGFSFVDMGPKDFRKIIAWFKSLPERFNLQPKVDWTEEDEKDLENIRIYLLHHGEDDWANVLTKLKSIKSSQKSNEE